MKYLIVIAIAICGFECTNGRTLLEDKIIGGTLASPGQFPHQISQRVNGGHYCGGSIIDKNTILSAAHCIDGLNYREISIIVGSNQINQGGQWYSVLPYRLHPRWNPSTFANDIAVFKVERPIQFSTHVKPIIIDYNLISSGSECTLSGWGLTTYPGTAAPNDLMYFSGNVVDLNQCRQKLSFAPFPVLNSNICSYASNGVGVCRGDSGGALLADNKQIGITSWVVYCAIGYPDVYTRVSSYRYWIEAQQAK